MTRHAAIGITAADAEWSAKRGAWLRPHTLDDLICGEAATYLRALPPRPDDVLLDIGGHIGAVALAYLRADPGPARVISVEPEPDNLALLRRNLAAEPRFELVPAAVVGADQSAMVPLYVSVAGNRGAHSTWPRQGHPWRAAIDVPAVPFAALLATYRPTLLKVDCEGGEYGFAAELGQLPAHVRGITLELHLSLNGQRERGLALDASLRAQGFTVVAGSKALATARFALRTYVRGL